ncbi:hypothetical protein DAMA08_034150 [Martiniozyma asiatica (nom. inval.)]|nr:hypothetical protein DAMA08_034150 [Martiniozyma asiatica]
MTSEIVIIGAGITGLYTAFSLVHDAKVEPSKITIVAEYFPGDWSKGFTSPWAGGNFSCISASDPLSLENDKITYTNLPRIREILGGEEKSSIAERPAIDVFEFPLAQSKIDSLKTYVKNFRVTPQDELPKVASAKAGLTYTTYSFYVPKYLTTMYSHLKELGVVFMKKKLDNINQAWLNQGVSVVFNCSGLGSKTLGGVEDTTVYPTRGQVVIVEAPHVQVNMCKWNLESATYIIPRPHSGGQLVLGGFLQKGVDNGDTFASETEDIIKRCTELCPAILDHPLKIIREASGLRPTRNGGARIEGQVLEDGKLIVHNYGAGGYGYQSGYGMAVNAVKIYQNHKKLKSKL